MQYMKRVLHLLIAFPQSLFMRVISFKRTKPDFGEICARWNAENMQNCFQKGVDDVYPQKHTVSFIVGVLSITQTMNGKLNDARFQF